MLLLVEGRELAQILLAAGADPTAQDAQHGRTALHTAAMANDVELVKVKKLRYDFILVPSPFLCRRLPMAWVHFAYELWSFFYFSFLPMFC